MKIVFSGAAGIGKTTLARATAEELSLPFIEERYGDFASALGELDKARIHRDKVRAKIGARKALLSWIEAWSDKAARSPGFVSDRSPIDILHLWNAFRLNTDEMDFMQFLEFCCSRIAIVDAFVIPPFPRVSAEAANEARLRRTESGEEHLSSHASLVGYHELFARGRTINIPIECVSFESRMGVIRKMVLRK
jgi:hypothetical protein